MRTEEARSSTQTPSIASASPVLYLSPPTSTTDQESTPSVTSPTPPPSENPQCGIFDERYSLLHLELLHHFQTDLVKSLGLDHLEVEPVMQLTIKEAFATPFLMDELLALSAAHKAALPDNQRREYYRTEATRLQTRALAQFNEAQASLSGENRMAVFLFSTYLGQHVLHDTLQQASCHTGDIEPLLDKLGQCLNIHHGIAHIAGQSWEELVARFPEFDAHRARHHEVTDVANEPESECYPLMHLIKKSYLDESGRAACSLAVERLQQLINTQRTYYRNTGISGPLINFVQEWLVRAPPSYVYLVIEKRPEALAILAHYLALLHQARDCWVVGNAGSFLVRSISKHLGKDWAEWLAWPNQMVTAVS